MALRLHSIVVLIFCATFTTCVFTGDNDCQAYWDSNYTFHDYQQCKYGMHCCGTCNNRECCSNPLEELSEEDQYICGKHGRYVCNLSPPFPFVSVTIIVFVAVLISFCCCCCCCCKCCCLYSRCRKPRPPTHTTVFTSVPQHCPELPEFPPLPTYEEATSLAGVPQPYQGPAQCPPYQPMPVQPGYGIQTMPTVPYQGQPFPPLPTYQEATGPAYPPQPMPYSQAAYSPGQPAYPLQPPVQPQPNAPPGQMDYLSQPAFNPDYAAPPKTG